MPLQNSRRTHLNFASFARGAHVSLAYLGQEIKSGNGPRTERIGPYVKIPIEELAPFKARLAAERRAEAQVEAQQRAADQAYQDTLEATRLRAHADALDPSAVAD